MKSNIFNVREKKDKRIIIEEERFKNPFLLFLMRHRNFILISLIMSFVCLILISTGIAFSLFQGSNDYDITYIEGSEIIDSNKDPEIDDDDIKDELLGEVAREQGIVLLVKKVMSPRGDIIFYYTDSTSVIIQSNGKIYRVSSNKKGQYGVNDSGKIEDTAKKILVTSTTTTLMDGTLITYYSDGSASVEYKTQTYFVRDSNNIKLNNGSELNSLSPSGVAPIKSNQNVSGKKIIKFTDNTYLIIDGAKKYIVNKNSGVSINGNNVSYNKHNSFSVISEKIYNDGNVITHFQNGSAIIDDQKGNITYVKNSGDILLRKKKLYEIMPNDLGFSRSTLNTSNNKKVIYFDNGVGIIINENGVREYVDDNDNILFDSNNQLINKPQSFQQISEKVTTDGEKVFNFSNGKSQVIRENGSSYIIDTSKLVFKPDGTIEEDEEVKEEDDLNHAGVVNPGEGIYISEAENEYNDFKNVENTKFIIKNKNTTRKTLRITIEEVNNYGKYNTSRLDPRYVKFQATIGDNYIPASKLTANTWRNTDGVTNYVIYDGVINAKQTVDVALSLYIDYAELNNSHQNKGFIGTIKVYVEDGT